MITTGDFNINLFRPVEVLQRWKDIKEAFSLTQLIDEPTQVTVQRQSLLDHFHITDSKNILKLYVPKLGLSDHFLTYLVHKINGHRIGQHTIIKYRSYRA